VRTEHTWCSGALIACAGIFPTNALPARVLPENCLIHDAVRVAKIASGQYAAGLAGYCTKNRSREPSRRTVLFSLTWHSHCLDRHADLPCTTETISTHFAAQDKDVSGGTGQKSPKPALSGFGLFYFAFLIHVGVKQ
jgi:hypothetical protein